MPFESRPKEAKAEAAPFRSTVGEGAKGLANVVTNAINKIWPKSEPRHARPAANEVAIDAMRFYDEAAKNDHVEVASASEASTSTATVPSGRPPPSSPITIPRNPNRPDRLERIERHYI